MMDGTSCRNGRKPENRMSKRKVVNESWEKRGRRMASITLHLGMRGSHLCGKGGSSKNEGKRGRKAD